MATLADSVYQNASQSVAKQGTQVRDAVEAYHIASTTANARDQLEMQKQAHEVNKANSIISTFSNISKLPPAAQDLALESLGKTLPQFIPGANPEVLNMFKKDRDTRQAAFTAVAPLVKNGGVQNPEQAQRILSMFGGDVESAASFVHSAAQLETQRQIGMTKANASSGTLDYRREALDRRTHQQVINKLSNDKILGQRITQYQNLDNALRLITDPESLTPQQIHDFQQTVRGNLGIKGQGGVGEREETYFKSLGLKSTNWKQFLTGEPAQLAKDTKLMAHLKNLAAVEQSNISGQVGRRFDALAAGAGSMYARRPDLLQDRDEAIAAHKASFGGGAKAGGEGDVEVIEAGSKTAAPKGGVVDMIKQAASAGKTKDQIRNSLLKKSLSSGQIDSLLEQAGVK